MWNNGGSTITAQIFKKPCSEFMSTNEICVLCDKRKMKRKLQILACSPPLLQDKGDRYNANTKSRLAVPKIDILLKKQPNPTVRGEGGAARKIIATQAGHRSPVLY